MTIKTRRSQLDEYRERAVLNIITHINMDFKHEEVEPFYTFNGLKLIVERLGEKNLFNVGAIQTIIKQFMSSYEEEAFLFLDKFLHVRYCDTVTTVDDVRLQLYCEIFYQALRRYAKAAGVHCPNQFSENLDQKKNIKKKIPLSRDLYCDTF